LAEKPVSKAKIPRLLVHPENLQPFLYHYAMKLIHTFKTSISRLADPSYLKNRWPANQRKAGSTAGFLCNKKSKLPVIFV
jgi:hypothetical protein